MGGSGPVLVSILNPTPMWTGEVAGCGTQGRTVLVGEQGSSMSTLPDPAVDRLGHGQGVNKSFGCGACGVLSHKHRDSRAR